MIGDFNVFSNIELCVQAANVSILLIENLRSFI
jgi:hypothetical protein